MTELEFYKWINDNDVEYHWTHRGDNRTVIIFPTFDDMKELNKLQHPNLFDDEGIECKWMNGYLAIWAEDICDSYGIELENVFTQEHNR